LDGIACQPHAARILVHEQCRRFRAVSDTGHFGTARYFILLAKRASLAHAMTIFTGERRRPRILPFMVTGGPSIFIFALGGWLTFCHEAPLVQVTRRKSEQ
jgi:hypothetical protein